MLTRHDDEYHEILYGGQQGNGYHTTIDTDPISAFDALRIDDTAQLTSVEAQSPSPSIEAHHPENCNSGQMEEAEYQSTLNHHDDQHAVFHPQDSGGHTIDEDPIPTFNASSIDYTAQLTSLEAQNPSSPMEAHRATNSNNSHGQMEEKEYQSSYRNTWTHHYDQHDLLHRQGNGGHTIDTYPIPACDAAGIDNTSRLNSLEAQSPSTPMEAHYPGNPNNGQRIMGEEEYQSSYRNTMNHQHDQQDHLQRKGNHTIDTDPVPAFDESSIDYTARFASFEAQSPSSPIEAHCPTNSSNGQRKIDEAEYKTGFLESSKAADSTMNPSPQSKEQSTVVLLGKLGHGKTRMVNMICGETFDSNMGNGSCTRSMQVGRSLRSGISVIDTPGFYSCRDTTEHISQQKSALEGEPLNGIYAVVKFGRIDEMVEILNQIMDFCGNDDIRILITYMDIAASEQGFDYKETRDLLSESLDVAVENIGFVGKGDFALKNDEILATPEELEDFVLSTLHEPRSFEVSIEQSAYMSARSPGARQFESQLREMYERIETALGVCKLVSELSDSKINTYHLNQVKTAAIAAVQDCTQKAASDARTSILCQSAGLAAAELNVVHANVNVKLKLGVDRFISESDSLVTPVSFSYRYSYSDLYSGRRQRFPNQFRDRLTAKFGCDDQDSKKSMLWIVKRPGGGEQTMQLADLPKLALELQQSKRARKKRGKKKITRRTSYRNEPSVTKSTSKSSEHGHGFSVQNQNQLQLQNSRSKEETARAFSGVQANGSDRQDVSASQSLTGQDATPSMLSDYLPTGRQSDCVETGTLGKTVTTGTLARQTFRNKEKPSAHNMRETSRCDEANNIQCTAGGAPPLKDGSSISHSHSPLDQDDSHRARRETTPQKDVGKKAHTANDRKDSDAAVDQQNAEETFPRSISRGVGNPKKHTLAQDDSPEGPKRRRTAYDARPPLWYFCFLCCTSHYAE